jgi:superfamily II DNA or RNA helicase
MVLEVVANAKDGDHKHYIVAPPGAGKTIVGLELVRRYGRLIYTHHAEGRQILLAARSQQHGRVRQMAFELWK